MALAVDYVPSGTHGSAFTSTTGTGCSVTKTGTGGTLAYEGNINIPQPPSALRYTGNVYGGRTIAITTPLATPGISWEGQIPNVPASGANFFISLNQNGVGRIGDVAVLPGGALQFRDLNTVRKTTPTGLVASGDFVRIVLLLDPGSATTNQMLVFVRGNRYATASPDYSSGTFALTNQATATAIDRIFDGNAPDASGDNYDVLLGRVRISDDQTDPGSGYGSVPAAPTLTKSEGNATVTVTWGTIAGQTGVLVYRRTGTAAYTKVASQPSSAATSYTETGLTNGTQYDYMVKIQNSSGYSVGATISATPAATSTQYLFLDGDVQYAGSVAVNGSNSLVSSATLNNDGSSYVKIVQNGIFTATVQDPSTPLPSNSVLTVEYVLGPLQVDQCQMSLLKADGTVIAQDDPKTGPGTYQLVVPSTVLDTLTSSDLAGMMISLQDQGDPPPSPA